MGHYVRRQPVPQPGPGAWAVPARTAGRRERPRGFLCFRGWILRCLGDSYVLAGFLCFRGDSYVLGDSYAQAAKRASGFRWGLDPSRFLFFRGRILSDRGRSPSFWARSSVDSYRVNRPRRPGAIDRLCRVGPVRQVGGDESRYLSGGYVRLFESFEPSFEQE